jgi:hypothetical protein
MTPIGWAATTLSALVFSWLAASPEPTAATVTSPRAPTSEASLLARVEREVTTPLRERDADRWRFSRVHRPAPGYRTVADLEGSDGRYAAFRVVAGTRPLPERTVWLVRVDRGSGAVELAAALASGAQGEPAWQPLAHVLSPDASSIAR